MFTGSTEWSRHQSDILTWKLSVMHAAETVSRTAKAADFAAPAHGRAGFSRAQPMHLEKRLFAKRALPPKPSDFTFIPLSIMSAVRFQNRRRSLSMLIPRRCACPDACPSERHLHSGEFRWQKSHSNQDKQESFRSSKEAAAGCV